MKHGKILPSLDRAGLLQEEGNLALTLGQAARPGWSKGVWREKSCLSLVECVIPKGPQAPKRST